MNQQHYATLNAVWWLNLATRRRRQIYDSLLVCRQRVHVSANI